MKYVNFKKVDKEYECFNKKEKGYLGIVSWNILGERVFVSEYNTPLKINELKDIAKFMKRKMKNKENKNNEC